MRRLQLAVLGAALLGLQSCGSSGVASEDPVDTTLPNEATENIVNTEVYTDNLMMNEPAPDVTTDNTQDVTLSELAQPPSDASGNGVEVLTETNTM